MENKIIIKGARAHNLKNINLEIPKNQIVVFSGVSGSGKSSLAFDTIFAEGQRRYIESLSPYARQFLGQMQRADVDEINGLSPAIAIDQKALSHNPRSTVGTLTDIYDYLRVLFARLGEVFCPECGAKIEKLSNEQMVDIILDKAKKQKSKTISILSPVVRGRKGDYYQLLYNFLDLGFSQARIDDKMHSLHEQIILPRYKTHNIDIIIDQVMPQEQSRLFEAVENGLNFSQGLITVILDQDKNPGKERNSFPNKEEFMLSANWTCPKDNFAFPEITPRFFSFNSPYGACPICNGLGKEDLFLKTICPSCEGKRLRKESLAVKIKGKNIADISALSIEDVYQFFVKYNKSLNSEQAEIAQNLLKEITERLGFLREVGLGYLTLEREAETLSGGEAQRIRLSSQVGSYLSNTLYVLDEPTIGLHQRDTGRLINTLQALKQRNNTIIIVEHDQQTILSSDHLVDLGPWAGDHGGKVVAQGAVADLMNKDSKEESLTLDYLRGKKKIAVPQRRGVKINSKLTVLGARSNNLKNIRVEIPLHKLICLTGVSGSGKSSFLYNAFYQNFVRIKNGRESKDLDGVKNILGAEYIDKAVMIDQSPIGRTPRSNPATYTGIFTPIREFFSGLEESRMRGYSPSRFSFNVRAGRCETCQGAGYKLIEMHFLPPVLVECEVCHGKRFNRETLQIKHQGKNIADILEMTIDEAAEFFKDIYTIADKLKVLQSVGLGYLKLGQSATTLSGGEAQRIKLSRELNHKLGKRTLYLLDEPTVGLHYYDIEMLLKVLNKLVDRGNTVVVIEHNLDVIKSADWVIDLGPEAGDNGGKVIAAGTPEEVSQIKNSTTGQYLKKHLCS